MTSTPDYNAMLSGSKIPPLDSETKRHVPRDNHGVIGEAYDIEHTHQDPLDSPVKHHARLAHVDSQGVVGRDEVVQGSKIDPLAGEVKKATEHTQGLDDEAVDAARIKPMGGRED